MAQVAQQVKDNWSTAPFLPVKLGPRDYHIEKKPDGTIYLSSPHKLPEPATSLGERLAHWAKTTPDIVYMADRVDGAWRKTTYADTQIGRAHV